MGTHPIFESDFDCLTEWLKRIRIYSELNSETINGNMPIQQLSNIQPNMLEKMIEGIQSTLSKGIIENSWSKIAWEVNEKEFRQNAPPVPVFSTNACMGAVLGACSAFGARIVMRQPMYARIHAMALQVTAGYWAGYQWNKWCSKKNLSEYKHAVDFAERHSDIIHKQEATKFGSPQILEHWSLAESRLG